VTTPRRTEGTYTNTRGNAQEHRRSKGFDYSPVCTTLHQFSMKRVLSASWRASTHSQSLTSPASPTARANRDVATQCRTPTGLRSSPRCLGSCRVPYKPKNGTNSQIILLFAIPTSRRFPWCDFLCHDPHFPTLVSLQKTQGEPKSRVGWIVIRSVVGSRDDATRWSR
jgi:hypothetical protein